MKEQILISLCMIVKNEEASVRRCLESIQGVADEIIVTDTGSTDRTKEICGEYHAKIYDFPWRDSFSDARNDGLQKANGEWILWMDADEELSVPDISAFRDMAQSSKEMLLPVGLINFIGETPDRDDAYTFTSYRLFRNRAGLRFSGNIHEHLDFDQVSSRLPVGVSLPAEILHYGYLAGEVRAKDKSARNLRLLEKEAESPDYSPWIDYHRASEYYRLEDYEKAFGLINLSIRRFLAAKALPPSLAYKLKYDILLASGSFREAWPGIEKAIEIYPDYVDLHFYKGVILFLLERYGDAERAFDRCLVLGDGNPGYLSLKGTGSFHALRYLGECYEQSGQPVKARDAYRQALLLRPAYEEVKQRLKTIQKNPCSPE